MEDIYTFVAALCATNESLLTNVKNLLVVRSLIYIHQVTLLYLQHCVRILRKVHT